VWLSNGPPQALQRKNVRGFCLRYGERCLYLAWTHMQLFLIRVSVTFIVRDTKNNGNAFVLVLSYTRMSVTCRKVSRLRPLVLVIRAVYY